MMFVTKALPQDVALLAFIPKSQASVLLPLRFRRKINFTVPAESFACSERHNRQHEHSPFIPINFIKYPFHNKRFLVIA